LWCPVRFVSLLRLSGPFPTLTVGQYGYRKANYAVGMG
jgi:hypothetical protein